MLVFSNANVALKETILTSALAGSGSPATTWNTTCTVTTGTGVLFHDFTTDYYGENPVTREQPVTLYDDTGWYEEAYLTARTGDTLTISRRAEGQEIGIISNPVTWAAVPIGTKIAPVVSARTMKRMLQDTLPVKLTNGFRILTDSGVSISDSLTMALGWGSAATKQQAVAVGFSARCMAINSLSISGYPVIAKDDEARGSENYFTGMESFVSTISMSLSGGINWAASTTYKHGTVFKADPDDNLQYTLYCDSWKADQIEITTTTTEPAWIGADWDYTDVEFDTPTGSEFAYLLSTDWEGVGYELWFTNGVTFYPTEFIFVCDAFDTLTSDAVVTISHGSTIYVNAQAVSGLTGAHQIKRFPVTSNVGVRGFAGADGIKIHLDTPAVAARLEGRWLIKGFFIENMFNPPLSQYMGT